MGISDDITSDNNFEVTDNDLHDPTMIIMSYLGVGVSPGNVPVYHGTNMKVFDRKVRITELILRCFICGLALLSALLIGTDTQVKTIFTIQKKAKFTDMKALVFLVIANGMAATYSLLQVVRCVVSMIKGRVFFNKPLAWAIFSGDQDNSVAIMEENLFFAAPLGLL
ncbi:hypothetical protein ACFE04_001518 [Oxalis oulophora]